MGCTGATGPTKKELKQTINSIGDNIYHKNFSSLPQGSPIGLPEIAEKVAGTYRLELERNHSDYEFHTISLVAEKGHFANAVPQTFAPGDEDEPMMITRTKESDQYKHDAICSILALKRRYNKIDEGVKAGTREIDAAVRGAIKQILENEKNTRDKMANMRLVNKILLEMAKRVKALAPELRPGFMVTLMTPDIDFKVAYADTDKSEILRVEVQEISPEFNVLAIILAAPKA